MNFNDTIGRSNKEEILTWFNKGKPKKKILIIQGRSGNGKTLLPTALAETLHYEIQTITPDNIDDSTLETINQSISKKKLVLFDDFDEFHHSKRSLLYDAIELSVFPIIVTCTKWKFKSEIFGKSQYMRMKRPRTSEILSLLQQQSNLSKDHLQDIAINSDNVLQAITATLSGFIPERTHQPLSNKDKLSDLKKQRFTDEMKKDDVRIYFDDISKYSLADINTMIAFSYFDYITHQRFVPVDLFFINSIPSLPKTTFKRKIVTKKKKEKKKKQQPKKPVKKEEGLDLFF